VPIDYLNWIIEKSDLNEDVKFTANHYRRQRHLVPRVRVA
jgi:hypothetical protein